MLGKVKFGDGSYVTPDLLWLQTAFYDYFKRIAGQPSMWGLKGYTFKFQCNHFATLFAALAKVSHAKSPASEGESPAVGEFWYVKDKEGAHAINLVVVNTAHGLATAFIEPQTGQKLILTPHEVASCFDIRF